LADCRRPVVVLIAQSSARSCGTPEAIGNYPGLATTAGSDVGASGGRPLARRRQRNPRACAARPYKAVRDEPMIFWERSSGTR